MAVGGAAWFSDPWISTPVEWIHEGMSEFKVLIIE
jgi:hypothetical protein